jgi:hypothetical protein
MIILKGKFAFLEDSSSSILFVYTQKKMSGVENWYLDEFFEEFICGRIYLEQIVGDYQLCCMIFISSRRYSTKADDTHLTGMIFI